MTPEGPSNVYPIECPAAKVAGVEKASLLRSVGAVFAASFFSAVASGIISAIFGPGCLAIPFGVLGSMFGIKLCFRTSWDKSFVVWIIDLVALVVAILIVLGVALLLTSGVELPPPPEG